MRCQCGRYHEEPTPTMDLGKALIAAALIISVVYLHTNGFVSGLFWPGLTAYGIYKLITD